MRRPILFVLISVLVVEGCSDLGVPFKPMPRSQLSATTLDFGTVVVSRSTTRTVTITNAGTGTLTGTAELTCSNYSFQAGGGAYSLGAGQSKAIVIAFAPSSIGDFPCTLELGDHTPAVTLSGAAALQAPGARCIVLPDSIPFGMLVVGQSSLQTFEVINAGSAPLLIDVVPNCSEFEVLLGGGPDELAIGASKTVTVAFHPTVSGLASCIVEVGPDCPTVKVTGSATSVSFVSEIKPILTSRCGDCHDFANSADPRMYDRLVTDWNGSTVGYIKPFDVGNSYIYQRIKSPSVGDRMPQGGPYLTDLEVDKFRRWILEGALEN